MRIIMRGTLRIALPGMMAVCIAATGIGAQEWRTVDISRQLRDTAPHRVQVQYGAGRLDVHPQSGPMLFGMQLRYRDGGGVPLHEYDAAERILRIGLASQAVRFTGRSSDRTGELHVGLNPNVPLELDVEVGAARADLELGGLRLTDARIHTGAADANIRFTSPNLVRLEALTIEAGAASLDARGLANANTSSVRVCGGVGDLTLGFDGVWTQDMALDASVALGRLTLLVPREIGIHISVTQVLGSLEQTGMEKRSDGYYSANWDSAKYRLRVKVQTVLGTVQVERTPR
jgi:hypothetical protein